MNRREFIRSSLVLSTGMMAVRRAGAQALPILAPITQVPATRFRPLRRGVGIFSGRGGTIGWLSSTDALVVVDTQFPDTAAVCLKAVSYTHLDVYKRQRACRPPGAWGSPRWSRF